MENVRIYHPVKVAKEAARIVRKELTESPDIYSKWPPTEKEFYLKHSKQLLSQEPSCHQSSQNRLKTQIEIVDSIAQDLVFIASNGRKRVPKHVQLGLSIKRKTGSVSVILWLN